MDWIGMDDKGCCLASGIHKVGSCFLGRLKYTKVLRTVTNQNSIPPIYTASVILCLLLPMPVILYKQVGCTS